MFTFWNRMRARQMARKLINDDCLIVTTSTLQKYRWLMHCGITLLRSSDLSKLLYRLSKGGPGILQAWKTLEYYGNIPIEIFSKERYFQWAIEGITPPNEVMELLLNLYGDNIPAHHMQTMLRWGSNIFSDPSLMKNFQALWERQHSRAQHDIAIAAIHAKCFDLLASCYGGKIPTDVAEQALISVWPDVELMPPGMIIKPHTLMRLCIDAYDLLRLEAFLREAEDQPSCSVYYELVAPVTCILYRAGRLKLVSQTESPVTSDK